MSNTENSSFYDNYDNINWSTPSNERDRCELVTSNGNISLSPPKSILQQIAQEKGAALQQSFNSIKLIIPYLYELQGLLAYYTKCPAKDRRDIINTIEELFFQVEELAQDIKTNISVIKIP